jgi:hypothetical protein
METDFRHKCGHLMAIGFPNQERDGDRDSQTSNLKTQFQTSIPKPTDQPSFFEFMSYSEIKINLFYQI